MKRKGSAIMVAAILGSVFFIVVGGLLRFSSGEMRHVKAISAVRKAEMLALSGIDWAETELRQGRWYQKEFQPYEKAVGVHPTHGVKEIYPFGSDEGKVTIVCEDIANAVPGTNVRGMQRLWYLHHVNVYAMGEYEGQKALVYGRFIVSPEPALNSKSTDASEYESPAFGDARSESVKIRSAVAGGVEMNEFMVKKIKVSQNQTVNINTVLAILTPLEDPSAQVELRPRTNGRISNILMSESDVCSAGQFFAVLDRAVVTAGGVADPKTLKKIVRVTKIPPQVWDGLSIKNRNDRFALASYVSGLSDSFLINFVARTPLQEALDDLGDAKLNEKLSPSELLQKFPPHVNSTTRNRAENTFLTHMLQNFTVPGGNWASKERSLDSTYLELDHPHTDPPEDLRSWLAELGLTRLLNTKPRVNPRYYKPSMKRAEFVELLRPKFNVDPAQFVSSLSLLPDASRFIDIEEGPYGAMARNYPDESQDFFEIILPDKEVKVTVEKVAKDYVFVDPETNFSIQMDDLMSFLRKYYDDSNAVAPREDMRVTEHIDWPLPKPAGTPPAPRAGGTWSWIPGIPGTPPGDPTWNYRGGKKVEVPTPTGGNRSFEPQSPNPDGGTEIYRIAGIPETSTSDSSSHGGADMSPESSIFSDLQEPIELQIGGTWDSTPGTPGVDPTEGSYIWVEDPPPPESDSDETTRECTTCCFPAETLILMADGTSIPIKDVEIGDLVASYDTQTKTRVEGKVVKLESPVRDHITTITFSGGAELSLTDEHPLYTENGWASIDPGFTLEKYGMKTDKLRVGTKVLGSDEEWYTIVKLLTLLEDQKMYNLAKVEPAETFFADGFLAHNKPVTQSESSDPGGDPSAGGSGTGTDGSPGSDGSGSGSDGLAGSPGDGSGGGSALDGTGTGPGAGGSATGTSGRDPSAGGSGTSTDGSAPGSGSGSSGSSTGPGTPGSSGTTSPSGSSGGGASSPGSTRPGGSSRPSPAPVRTYRSTRGGV